MAIDFDVRAGPAGEPRAAGAGRLLRLRRGRPDRARDPRDGARRCRTRARPAATRSSASTCSGSIPATASRSCFIDVHDGGAGGRPDHDGPVLVFAGDGDTRNTPVEVIETRYPRPGRAARAAARCSGRGASAAAPASRGTSGCSSAASTCSSRSRTRSTRSRRVWTAARTARRAPLINPGTDREVRMTDRVTAYGPLEAGDLISVRSGGGGGFRTHGRLETRPRAAHARAVSTNGGDGSISRQRSRSWAARSGSRPAM